MSILIVDDDCDIRTVLSLRLQAESFEVDVVDSAFEAGAMDYLTKPFNRIELLVRIRSALRLKHAIDQRKGHEMELTATIERLKSANAMLETLSTTDELTGIYNRRYFDITLAKEYQRARRLGSRLALIMIDIDRFKDFNDQYGHQTGDECLKTVAHELSAAINRSHDLVARYRTVIQCPGSWSVRQIEPCTNRIRDCATREPSRNSKDISIRSTRVKSQYLAFDELLISSKKVVASCSKSNDKTSCLSFSDTGLSSIVGDGSGAVIFCDLPGDKDAWRVVGIAC